MTVERSNRRYFLSPIFYNQFSWNFQKSRFLVEKTLYIPQGLLNDASYVLSKNSIPYALFQQ